MRTLIVFNHPYKGSFCSAILSRITETLRGKGEAFDVIHLDDDGFNPVMSTNDLKAFVLAAKEPGKALAMLDAKVLSYKARLEQAEHIVFIFPVWWALMPALTKGFIDKVIFPAIAYEYDASGAMHSRLKRLKKVTVVTTMNTPAEVYKTNLGNAVERALFSGVFDAVGFTNCRWISLNMVKQVSRKEREEWLNSLCRYFDEEE